MKNATSKQIGEALLAAVGLAATGVRCVTLKCEAGQLATLAVERLVPTGALEAPVIDLARYRLVDDSGVADDAVTGA
jgi:hypothetical protein